LRQICEGGKKGAVFEGARKRKRVDNLTISASMEHAEGFRELSGWGKKLKEENAEKKGGGVAVTQGEC